MGAIYVCRHGQTDMNVRGCLQGRTDTQLNETGREQARGAAQFLRDNEILIDEVRTSPLSRAVESAEIISGIPHELFTMEHSLIEMSFGDWEGLALDSLPQEERDRFFENSDLHPAPGGETASEVIDRVGKFLGMMKMRRRYQDRNILLSSHGALIHGLTCYVKGLPPEKFWTIKIANCEILKLDLDAMKLETIFPGYVGEARVG